MLGPDLALAGLAPSTPLLCSEKHWIFSTSFFSSAAYALAMGVPRGIKFLEIFVSALHEATLVNIYLKIEWGFDVTIFLNNYSLTTFDLLSKERFCAEIKTIKDE